MGPALRTRTISGQIAKPAAHLTGRHRAPQTAAERRSARHAQPAHPRRAGGVMGSSQLSLAPTGFRMPGHFSYSRMWLNAGDDNTGTTGRQDETGNLGTTVVVTIVSEGTGTPSVPSTSRGYTGGSTGLNNESDGSAANSADAYLNF